MITTSRPVAQYTSHSTDIQAAIAQVLTEGRYVLGPRTSTFESNFATWCGVKHAVGVGNGTDAITVALAALGVEAKDEVITVAHTAVATIAGIVHAGATPIMVDIDPTTWTMDPNAVEAAIGPHTRVILPVHIYGHPANMTDLLKLAHRHNLIMIEDCAQAPGATWCGTRVGALSDAGTFSFYPTKNLGAIGDGGAVVLNDDAPAKAARAFREYGWNNERISYLPGFNSRLDELQAAILSIKLPDLDADNARRQAIAQRYNTAFADLPIRCPQVAFEATHAWHLYVIALAERNALREHLAENRISTGIHYPIPVHKHPAWVPPYPLNLPHTERAAKEVLSLPIYPELSEKEIECVIAGVRSFPNWC